MDIVHLPSAPNAICFHYFFSHHAYMISIQYSKARVGTPKNLVSHFEKSNNSLKTANKMLINFWRPVNALHNVHQQPTILQQSNKTTTNMKL